MDDDILGHEPETSIFPDDWVPTYDIIDIADDVINNSIVNATALDSITSILSSSTVSSMIPDATKLNTLFGLQTDVSTVKTTLTQLQNTFCKNLDTSNLNSVDGVTALGDDVISQAENIINQYESLEKYATDIMDRVEYTVDYISEFKEKYIDNGKLDKKLDEMSGFVSGKVDKLVDKINKYIDGFKLETFLSTLPDKILENVCNLSIVKDVQLCYQSLKTSIALLVVSIKSLQSPTSITAVKSILSTLRTLLGIVKSVKSQVERVQQSIERLNALVSKMSNIMTGNLSNLISTGLSLASGGLLFFERVTSYAAKYPYNLGFRTVGGIVFEADSTPNKQRVELTMPSGAGVKMSPKGDLDIKATAGSQIQAKGEMEVHGEKDITISASGNVRIVASGNTQIETAGSTILSSVGTVAIMAGSEVSVADCNVSAVGNCVIHSGVSTVVSSVLGTEIKSEGLLTLSGKVVNIVSKGQISMIAAGAVHIAGTMVNVAGTNINLKAGLITLN